LKVENEKRSEKKQSYQNKRKRGEKKEKKLRVDKLLK